MSLQTDIDRGLEIVAEIAKLEKELDGLEQRIREHATTHPEQHSPLGEADREGRQYLAKGSTLVVPVIFTADKLVGSFQKDSKEHHRISELLMPLKDGNAIFGRFFKPWNGYESRFSDGQKFRQQAGELLGEKAPEFITACKALDKHGLPKHDVKIEWKHAAAEAKLREVAA